MFWGENIEPAKTLEVSPTVDPRHRIRMRNERLIRRSLARSGLMVNASPSVSQSTTATASVATKHNPLDDYVFHFRSIKGPRGCASASEGWFEKKPKADTAEKEFDI